MRCSKCPCQLFTKESIERGYCIFHVIDARTSGLRTMNAWPTPSSDELALEAARDREATERMEYGVFGLAYTY